MQQQAARVGADILARQAGAVSMRIRQCCDSVATVAVVLSPAIMLSVRGGTGYCFFLILALALPYLYRAANRRRVAALLLEHRLFALGLTCMPAVILLQMALFHNSTLPSLDPFVRLLLAVPIFLYLSSLSSKQLGLVQWGYAAGAAGSGAWAVYAHFHPEAWAFAGRLGNSFTNPIPFGDTALLLAFLSIIPVSFGKRVRPLLNVIRVAACLLGGYASYLSGSRGGWIALPLFIWASAGGLHRMNSRRARIALGCVVVAFCAVLAPTKMVVQRVDAVLSDAKRLQQGDIDTSMGLRLELWRASALLYLHHPVSGVGRGRLEQALDDLARRGEAPRAIVNSGAHSEFFSALSQMGTPGVAALLLLYIGTFVPFWRNRRSADRQIAVASYQGIATVGGTIIFGLTIDALTLVMSAAFFALNVATLLAWIEARKRETGEVAAAARPFMSRRAPRTVLVVCPRRIGDVLLVTPLVRSMKAQWPDAHIDMLVLSGTEGAVEHNPDLRRVMIDKPDASRRERLALMLRIFQRYSLACAAIDSDRALIYACLAGRKRIGLVNADRVKRSARIMLDRMAMDRHLDSHVVTNTLELAPLVNVTPLARVVAPGIGPDPRRRAQLEARFPETPAVLQGQPVVVLHPSSAFSYKQWTVEGWVATVRWLREQGFAIALSGGPARAEREYARQIIAAAGEPVLNLIGELTLGETAELIRHAKLFIGPDTGVTHIAAACGTLTIALFGPSDPVRWGPWPADWLTMEQPWARRGSGLRGNVYLLQGAHACVPCRHEGCDQHRTSRSDCLTDMPASRVIAVAAQLLKIEPPVPTSIVNINRAAHGVIAGAQQGR